MFTIRGVSSIHTLRPCEVAVFPKLQLEGGSKAEERARGWPPDAQGRFESCSGFTWKAVLVFIQGVNAA